MENQLHCILSMLIIFPTRRNNIIQRLEITSDYTNKDIVV